VVSLLLLRDMYEIVLGEVDGGFVDKFNPETGYRFILGLNKEVMHGDSQICFVGREYGNF